MSRYVWQSSAWPKFKWKSEQIIEALGKARKEQGKLMAQASFIGLEEKASFIIEEVLMTSAIEGEVLDKASVRSSVAKRLGLSLKGLPPSQRHVDGLVEMLMDANQNHLKNLTKKRLYSWHAALFPTGYSGLLKIKVGSWRKGDEPMQVVSGPIGKEKVHYQAPPANLVDKEIKSFLGWWQKPPEKMDGIIRAAVAHFWFVTIHPFEDGNGRVTRAITEMALAQDEQSNMRIYSLSSQIEKEKKDYYNILEEAQKSKGDLTKWIEWFLGMFTRSIENSYAIINKALYISKFWQQVKDLELNKRQSKVLQKMLEAEPEGFAGGISNKKYVNITKTSRKTANRDLSDLESKEIIIRNSGKGRSVSYSLKGGMKKTSLIL